MLIDGILSMGRCCRYIVQNNVTKRTKQMKLPIVLVWNHSGTDATSHKLTTENNTNLKWKLTDGSP
jgi:hypothetical protein